jgi:hypothetical protein
MGQSDVTNTTRQVQDNPMGAVLEEMALGGHGRSIEAMESRGQAELVNSELLPAEGTADPAVWERYGKRWGSLWENP